MPRKHVPETESFDEELLGHNFNLKRAEYPDNVCLSSFDEKYYRSLPELPDAKKSANQRDFSRCIRSAVDNPAESKKGCYACQKEDYDRFKPFFSKVLAEYHCVSEDAKHVTSWSPPSAAELPKNGIFDLAELGLTDPSVRVRVARNLEQFPLQAVMTKEERCEMENFMVKTFDTLIEMPAYGGKYYSFTPGHAKHVDSAPTQLLADQQVEFHGKSVSNPLRSAGIAEDWPHGRGIYISDDRSFVVWVGGEDHLRLTVTQTGTVLDMVFEKLKTALDILEDMEDLSFARTEHWGYVTSCPMNLGTGMRASLCLPLPNLTCMNKDRTFSDMAVKQITEPLGVSVRGLDEHGSVEISPSARFCVTEGEIVTSLYVATKQLKQREDQARESAKDTDKEEDRAEALKEECHGYVCKKLRCSTSERWIYRSLRGSMSGLLVGLLFPFIVAYLMADPQQFRGTGPSARLLIGQALGHGSEDQNELRRHARHALWWYMEPACWNESLWLTDCRVRDSQPAYGPLSQGFGWASLSPEHSLWLREEEEYLGNCSYNCLDASDVHHPEKCTSTGTIGCCADSTLGESKTCETGYTVGNSTPPQNLNDRPIYDHYKNANWWVVWFGRVCTGIGYHLLLKVLAVKWQDTDTTELGTAASQIWKILIFDCGILVLVPLIILLVLVKILTSRTDDYDDDLSTDDLDDIMTISMLIGGAIFIVVICCLLVARCCVRKLLAWTPWMIRPLLFQVRYTVIYFALGALTIQVLLAEIAGNGYGIPVMSQGTVVTVQSGGEMFGIIVGDKGGCKWVPNNENTHSELDLGYALSPAACIKMVEEYVANSAEQDSNQSAPLLFYRQMDKAIANMPMSGAGSCRVQFLGNDSPYDHSFLPETSLPQVYTNATIKRKHEEYWARLSRAGRNTPLETINAESQRGGRQSCLLHTQKDYPKYVPPLSDLHRLIDWIGLVMGGPSVWWDLILRQFLSFALGLLIGGGLFGAALGYTLVPCDQKTTYDHPKGQYRLYPLIGFLIFGTLFGVVFLWWDVALDRAQPYILSSAESNDGTGILSRDILERRDKEDPKMSADRVSGHFAVQFAKLYREHSGGFRQDMVQTFACAIMSLVWDFFVLLFHFLTPPHPKFKLRWFRRFCINTHIMAGAGEIVCSVLAFVYYDEGLSNSDLRMRLVYMMIVCSYVHAITAVNQAMQVFGMQCVMIPAYAVVIFWKMVCATRLGLDPESLTKLIELFFVHHIYVWCRAFHFCFEKIGIFEESTYTISIMFAGFVCGPLTLGLAGNLMIMAVVTMYCFVFLPFKDNPENAKLERRSNMFLNGKWRQHIDKLKGMSSSRAVNALASKDSILGGQASVMPVCAPSNLQPIKAVPQDGGETVVTGARVAEVLVKPGQLVRPGQPLVRIDDRLPKSSGDEEETEVTARTIFKAMDTDESGWLQTEEIVAVLVSWGVPRLEATKTVDDIISERPTAADRDRKYVHWKHPDKKNPDGTPFYEFKEEWEPIWRFQVSRADEATRKYRRFTTNDRDREERVEAAHWAACRSQFKQGTIAKELFLAHDQDVRIGAVVADARPGGPNANHVELQLVDGAKTEWINVEMLRECTPLETHDFKVVEEALKQQIRGESDAEKLQKLSGKKLRERALELGVDQALLDELRSELEQADESLRARVSRLSVRALMRRQQHTQIRSVLRDGNAAV